MLFLQQNMSPCFFSCFFLTRSSSFLVELRLPVALLSLFLCLSLFSRFVDMTINLHLILQTTRIQKHFPLSVFVRLILQLSLLKMQVAIRFPAKMSWHLASAYMKWVYGRSAFARYVITKFSCFHRFQFILATLLRHARFARGSSATKV